MLGVGNGDGVRPPRRRGRRGRSRAPGRAAAARRRPRSASAAMAAADCDVKAASPLSAVMAGLVAPVARASAPARQGRPRHRADSHFPRWPGPNECGSSSSSAKLARTPSRPATWMRVAASANSRMRWRQPPHGVHRSSPSPTTTISAILPLAGERHRGDRAGLGARALRIGGVLDVAAGVDRAARRADRRADEKARVRRVGALTRRLGGGEQRLEAVQRSLT